MNGSMRREDLCADLVSPDAEKITAIQISTGSQYLTNDFSFDTAHRKPGEKGLCNLKSTELVESWLEVGLSLPGIGLTLATNLSLLERVRLNSC